MEFLFVPAGAFQMGSDNGQKDEKPAHTVNLPGYWIGKYEATVGQFRKFMQATGHQPEGNIEEWGKDDRLPVGKASWQDAVAYCRWARVRLPTEAEWERAARGTDGRTYPWGNGWNQRLANTADGGPGRTMGVGGFPGGASPYGCLDIAGNVWEWCSSTYRPYPYRADDGREDPNDSSSHVLRGGGCGFDRGGARVSFRASYSGGGGYDLAGFRCARSEQSLSEPQSERRSVRQQIFIEMAKPNKKPKVQSTHPAARR